MTLSRWVLPCIVVILFSVLTTDILFASNTIHPPCDGEDYHQMSRRLRELFTADQKDREDFQNKTQKQMIEMLKRDRKRRKKVAEIFAKGCLNYISAWRGA